MATKYYKRDVGKKKQKIISLRKGNFYVIEHEGDIEVKLNCFGCLLVKQQKNIHHGFAYNTSVYIWKNKEKKKNIKIFWTLYYL